MTNAADYLEAFRMQWSGSSGSPAPRLGSLTEDPIVLPGGRDTPAWRVDWFVAAGSLVSPEQEIVRAQSHSRPEPWTYVSPVPALVDILPLPAARLPGGTQIGTLRYGEALEAFLRRLRRQQDAKRRRLQEEADAARRRTEQATASLGALRQALADLTAEEQRLTQEVATRRDSLRDLRSAPADAPEEIPAHRLLAALLQRLASAPAGSAVGETLRAPLLRLLAALVEGGTPQGEPADAAAACTALARLYDRRMKTVLAAQPGLPPALAAQKATLWHQLRETHLALLRNAVPAGAASPSPSAPAPQEKTP
jgi:hypothetical protein